MFNIEFWERIRLQPLDFDGLSYSIYQAFDMDGNRHMEHLVHWEKQNARPGSKAHGFTQERKDKKQNLPSRLVKTSWISIG